jgi:phosphoketolase
VIQTTNGRPLSGELLRKMDAWRTAANYLSVGQIYLYENAPPKKPLTANILDQDY